MKKSILALGLAGLVAASSASAQVGVAANLGTTGAGAHFSVPLLQSLNARIGVNGLSYSYDGSTSDVDYDFKLKLQTVDALLDWFPMNGGFRVSAGAVYNGNKIDARAVPNATGTYTLNGTTYSAAAVGTIDGKIDFRKVSPYLGIGWGNAVAKDAGWSFSADLGVMFHGKPKAVLTNNGCNPLICDQVRDDVAAENAKLNDDLESFKAYPVIRFGVAYKF